MIPYRMIPFSTVLSSQLLVDCPDLFAEARLCSATFSGQELGPQLRRPHQP
jgi:hypothetical protein